MFSCTRIYVRKRGTLNSPGSGQSASGGTVGSGASSASPRHPPDSAVTELPPGALLPTLQPSQGSGTHRVLGGWTSERIESHVASARLITALTRCDLVDVRPASFSGLSTFLGPPSRAAVPGVGVGVGRAPLTHQPLLPPGPRRRRAEPRPPVPRSAGRPASSAAAAWGRLSGALPPGTATGRPTGGAYLGHELRGPLSTPPVLRPARRVEEAPPRSPSRRRRLPRHVLVSSRN